MSFSNRLNSSLMQGRLLKTLVLIKKVKFTGRSFHFLLLQYEKFMQQFHVKAIITGGQKTNAGCEFCIFTLSLK